MITLLPVKLDDEKAERVRRNHADALAELQRMPVALERTIRDVTLADGVTTPIAHGLGRAAFVSHTPPRGALSAGYLVEVRDGTHDRSKFVVLQANGFGAAITIDLKVQPL